MPLPVPIRRHAVNHKTQHRWLRLPLELRKTQCIMMCGVYHCHYQARFLDQVLADNLL